MLRAGAGACDCGRGRGAALGAGVEGAERTAAVGRRDDVGAGLLAAGRLFGAVSRTTGAFLGKLTAFEFLDAAGPDFLAGVDLKDFALASDFTGADLLRCTVVLRWTGIALRWTGAALR